MKRHLGILTMLLLVATAPAAALAATHKAKSRSVTATIQTVTLSSQGNPPISGSSVAVGTVKGKLGSGAIVGATTFAAPNFTTKFTLFLAHGTLKGSFSGSGTVNQDGSGSATGKGKVTGGTDTYKGSKGKFTFTASAPANGPATFQVKGTINY